MMNDMKKVGKKISLLREKMKMTQAMLSNIWNVDQSLISKIEKGERTVTIAQLEKLSDIAVINVDYFFNDEELKDNTICFRSDNNKININNFDEIKNIGKLVKNIRWMRKRI